MQKIFKLGLCGLTALTIVACSYQNSSIATTQDKQTASLASVMKYLNDDTRLVPTKIFDNLYCIGSVSVVCYALKTSEGIILIDSMWDDNDAKFIEQSLIALNLDPKDIKYIFLTHGHGDHYGGATYLADKYKAKVLMSQIDTEYMLTNNQGANGSRSPKAKVDIYVDDNYKLTLGDTTVTLLATPGHTPGCMSAMFDVKDGKQIYTTVLWGGTGLPQDRDSQEQYLKSALYFYDVAIQNNAKVLLTAHLFADNGFAMLDAVNAKAGNPFIKSDEAIKEGLMSYINSAKAKLAE